MNKEEIEEIVERTREEAKQHFADCRNDRCLLEIIAKLLEMNYRQLNKREDLIHYYRSEIEALDIAIQDKD